MNATLSLKRKATRAIPGKKPLSFPASCLRVCATLLLLIGGNTTLLAQLNGATDLRGSNSGTRDDGTLYDRWVINGDRTNTKSYLRLQNGSNAYNFINDEQALRISRTTSSSLNAIGDYIFGLYPDGRALFYDDIQIINNGKLTLPGSGSIGIGTVNPSYKLHAKGDVFADGGWFRASGDKGLYFQNYGGGFFMQDNSWIRTYGNKNFYHNTGIMRTDGSFQVGRDGERFIVNGAGNVGVGTTNPDALLAIGNVGENNGVKMLGFGETGLNSFWFESGFQPYSGNNYMTLQGSVQTEPLMSWKLNGNVGIGIVNPRNKLDVAGTLRTQALEVIDASGDTLMHVDNEGKLNIRNSRSTHYFSADRIYITEGSRERGELFFSREGNNHLSIKTKGGDDIKFLTNNSNVVMTLKHENQNVGIGTEIPGEKLEVIGNIKGTNFIGDELDVTGNITGAQFIGDGLDVTGNVTGAQFIGDGSQLTNIHTDILRADDFNLKVNDQGTGNFLELAPERYNSDEGVFMGLKLAVLHAYATEPTPVVKISANGNTLFGSGLHEATEKVQVVGNVKATQFIGDGSQLTNVPSIWTTHGGNIHVSTGNVGIGVSNPSEKLEVNGRVKAGGLALAGDNTSHTIDSRIDGTIVFGGQAGSSEITDASIDQSYYSDFAVWVKEGIVVDDIALAASDEWAGTQPDYVFADDYALPSLAETEAFVRENRHLPDMPSQAEIREKGWSLPEMDQRLLKQVEELVLHTIEQQKQLEMLREQVAQLTELLTEK